MLLLLMPLGAAVIGWSAAKDVHSAASEHLPSTSLTQPAFVRDWHSSSVMILSAQHEFGNAPASQLRELSETSPAIPPPDSCQKTKALKSASWILPTTSPARCLILKLARAISMRGVP